MTRHRRDGARRPDEGRPSRRIAPRVTRSRRVEMAMSQMGGDGATKQQGSRKTTRTLASRRDGARKGHGRRLPGDRPSPSGSAASWGPRPSPSCRPSSFRPRTFPCRRPLFIFLRLLRFVREENWRVVAGGIRVIRYVVEARFGEFWRGRLGWKCLRNVVGWMEDWWGGDGGGGNRGKLFGDDDFGKFGR